MSAHSETAPTSAPRPGGGIGQSARDSLIIGKRNLIRMTRIPNRLRSGGFQFNSVGRHDLRVSATTKGTQ
ncbi:MULTISPECIES: hypothetical protein [unclassified Streptomyces]|uniref:hypothetical protein n=1 Tax=unclassified Streptomyces TaxID=2593676 RepID=UPI001F547224|nr:MULTISPECIES: hypothetical protein [unclassified Streptomyces]